MRLLIGTLHTIENEFEDCVDAIQRQTHRNFEHFIVHGLPNREAHDQLYETFMRRAGEFDLFIKIDADMVLCRTDLFARIVERFAARPDLLNLRIGVHDFFTDRLIGNLHAFSSSVRWGQRERHAFTDIDNIPRDRIEQDWTELAPAAWHCPDPSAFQAFHFGLHKGIKFQDARQFGWWRRMREHADNIEQVWRVYQRKGSLRRLQACVGAELALAGGLERETLNFDNTHTRELFESHANDTIEALAAWVAAQRRRRLKLWPSALWCGWQAQGIKGVAGELWHAAQGYLAGERR